MTASRGWFVFISVYLVLFGFTICGAIGSLFVSSEIIQLLFKIGLVFTVCGSPYVITFFRKAKLNR